VGAATAVPANPAIATSIATMRFSAARFISIARSQSITASIQAAGF
jgi:hypothetical protein